MYNRRDINNHIRLFYFIIGVTASIQLYIAYNAIGGVDIDVYWMQASYLDYTIPRYYREAVSWELIRFLAKLDRANFLFAFSILILSLAVLRLGIVGGLILYASFLSPFGVMMEFNVLRQCLGTVFLIFFILAILKDRRIAAVTWGALAILSHNSLLLAAGALLFANYYSLFSRNGKRLLLFSVIMLVITLELFGGLNLFLDTRAESYSNILDSSEQQNLIYLGFALIFSLLLYFKTQQRKWRPISVGLAGAVLFTLALCSLFSLASLVYGRMAITVVVICHFLLLYDVFETRRVGLIDLLYLLSIIVANGIIILFHPGALSMIEAYNA